MTNKEKIDYLNELFRKKGDFRYGGPKSLFKYRPFDKFSFDMFEKEYVYLCPAELEDDKTECDVSFDMKDYYAIQQGSLKRLCVEKIIEFIKPYVAEENYRIFRDIVHSIVLPDGTVRTNYLLDAYHEFKNYIPDEYAIAMVNWLGDIPNRMEDPKINSEVKRLFEIGYNAKKETGICSLCESSDNENMWEMYANNGTGYCIEYDVSNYYPYNVSIFPVVYQDERETNIVVNILGNYIGQLITGFSNGEIDADKSQFLRLFLTKNTEWAYQKEWRLLRFAGEKLPAPPIKAVYLGKNCSKENRLRLEIIAREKGFLIK